jgi:hypothetical protein
LKFATGPGCLRKILLLLVLSLPLLAQTPQGVWGERGISRRFVLRGELLYAADGRGVSVYDVSNPAAIRRIDVESGDDETRDLALVGSTDVVVATSQGIDRFSINADGTLTRLGSVEIDGGVTRIAASSTRIAAAAGKSLLLLERTGDALAVDQQRTFTENIRALAARGSIAYAAVERTAVFGIDMTSGETVATIGVDALGLAITGSTLWAAADIRGLFAVDLNTSSIVGAVGERTYRFADVAADGARVYATEGADRIHVFDGSKPGEPRLLGSMTEWVNVLAASGSRLFVAGAIVDSEKLTFETGVPLRAFDMSNPAAPVKLDEVGDLAGPVSGVWTDGSIAYVIDAPYLRVLDVSKTAQPREISSIVVPEIQDFIRVRDGLAINYGRLWVNLIDVTSPLKPKVIGSWHTQGHAPSAAAIARDTFVEANNHSGLHVVDYSNPQAPVQISGRIFHYLDVAAGDDAIYTIQQATFLTIDLTDRNRVVDRTVHSGQFFQLDTLPPNSPNPHHVVLRSAQGLFLYTLVPDRFAPRLVATVPMSTPGLFATNDDSVFVSRNGLLHRLDVAGPPGLTTTDMAVTVPMQMSIAGEKVVVADRYRLRVYGPDTAPPPAEPVRRRAVRH